MKSDQDPATSSSTTSNSSTQKPSCCGGPPGLRLGRVLFVAVPLGVLAGGALVAFAFFDLGTWLGNALRPPLVPVRVRVMYRGEVLKEAQVATVPETAGLRGAIGFPTEDGDIVLKTDVDGAYREGAYAGEHRVTVQVTEIVNRPGPPPLVTPPAYAAGSTTPLRIVIDKSNPNQLVTFELEGEPPTEGEPPAASGQESSTNPE